MGAGRKLEPPRECARSPIYIESVAGHRAKAGICLHRPSQPSQPSRCVDRERHPRRRRWPLCSPPSGPGARTPHTTRACPRSDKTSTRGPFLLPLPGALTSTAIETRGSWGHPRPSLTRASRDGRVLDLEAEREGYLVFDAAKPRDPKDRNRPGCGHWLWLGGRAWAQLGSPTGPRARAQPGRVCRGSKSGSRPAGALIRP